MAAVITRTLRNWFKGFLEQGLFCSSPANEVRKVEPESKKIKPKRAKAVKSSVDKQSLANVKRWLQKKKNRGVMTIQKGDFENICKVNCLNPEDVRANLASCRIIARGSKAKFYPFTCLLAKQK